MSHKRTASDAAASSSLALALGDIFADERYSDLAIHIGSFWSGKDFSTYSLAAQSSKTADREGDHQTRLSDRILQWLVKRCLDFLHSVGGPDTMKALLMDMALDVSDLLSAPISSGSMRQLSELCAFLDYCELTPIRLSKARLEQDELVRPIWMVGAGKFALPANLDGESNAILSVPSQTWRPELIFLGEKWLVQPREKLLGRCFSMDAGEMAGNIGHTAAVLSWDSSFYPAHMHKVADMGAGELVYHKFPDINSDEEIDGCYLNWLSKSFCKSMTGRYVREAMKKSDLKWMAKGTERGKNMLTAIEIDNSTIPQTHMNLFGERIVRLMSEVDKWCDGREDSVGSSNSN